MPKVRFGFIGAGHIAEFSADAIRKHKNADVVAIQDNNPDRLKEVSTQKRIESAHETAEELFANPDVDAVYIAVPNKFHAPLAIEALNAGKHVILEKPFAMNVTEAEAVIDAAEKSGKLFTLGMNQRFVEDAQKIKALAKDGYFGDIYHAKAYWLRREGIPRLGTWFGSKDLAGAGCINDIGVHMLDLCLHIIGNFEPVAVSGQTYTKFGNRGLGEGKWGKSERGDVSFDVDDFASALIKFENGATVTLDVSWACHTAEANRNDVEIFGTEAGASVYPAKTFENGPKKYETNRKVKTPIAYPHCERFHNFINAINGDEPLCVTPSEALAIQRILDAVNESSATGREVRLK